MISENEIATSLFSLKKYLEEAGFKGWDPFDGLNSQEMQILSRIAEGETNREIGAALHLSEKTVRNYVSNMLNKMELKSRAQAAAYAARHRIEEYL